MHVLFIIIMYYKKKKNNIAADIDPCQCQRQGTVWYSTVCKYETVLTPWDPLQDYRNAQIDNRRTQYCRALTKIFIHVFNLFIREG